jgi:hypothetical protein
MDSYYNSLMLSDEIIDFIFLYQLKIMIVNKNAHQGNETFNCERITSYSFMTVNTEISNEKLYDIISYSYGL